jgi:nitronate monooxygenase
MERYDRVAPVGYLEVHYLTTPGRAAAQTAGGPDLINLWAGQGRPLVSQAVSARDVIARMADEIRAGLDRARARL